MSVSQPTDAAPARPSVVVEVEIEAKPEVSPAPSARPASLQPAGLSPELLQAWARVLRIASAQPATRAILTNLQPVGADDARLLLRGEERYIVPARSRLAALGELLHKELGRRLEITLIDANGSAPGPTTLTPRAMSPLPAASPATAAEATSIPAKPAHDDTPTAIGAASPHDAAGPAGAASSEALASNHPIVRQAMELFGARIVSIQPRSPG